ncbi:MAG: GNAT family N-acetyltransferase [Planctomycetota bacterium]
MPFERRHVLLNLWPLQLHELAAHSGRRPNVHGLFEAERVEAYALDHHDTWWKEPGVLFPYLIEAEDLPAGFALVAEGARVGEDAARVVWEYFVLAPFRGTGVARDAAATMFAESPGPWQVDALTRNERAVRFWRRAMGDAFGAYDEEPFTDDDGSPMQRFRARAR